MKPRTEQEKRDLLARKIWECRKAIQQGKGKQISFPHWARGNIIGYTLGLAPSQETGIQVVRIVRGMRIFAYHARI